MDDTMHSGFFLWRQKTQAKQKTGENGSSGYTSYLSYCVLIYFGYNRLPEYSTGEKKLSENDITYISNQLSSETFIFNVLKII